MHAMQKILLLLVVASVLVEHRNREPYAALGLARWPKPSWTAVKKRYHELSLRYHPDRPTGDAERMRRVNEAYEYLAWLKQNNKL